MVGREPIFGLLVLCLDQVEEEEERREREKRGREGEAKV